MKRAILILSVLLPLTAWAAPAQKAADFSLPDLEGKKIRLSDFKGRVVLVDFWATWCIPCHEELPGLKGLYKKHKDQGFALLGISLDDAGQASVSKYAKDNDVPYPIVLAGGTDGIPEGYNVEGLPMAFLIDAKGLIRKRYSGQVDINQLEKDVSGLLKDNQRG
jgi:cytochrome c biogenesis protein CcmG/thiol:disulfide interchange protein DsbE